jgi:hypothetical protein
MAPPKKDPSKLSNNPHTLAERKRRANKIGFDNQLEKRKRSNQAAVDYRVKQLKATNEFKIADPAAQAQMKAAVKEEVIAKL